MSRVSKSQTKSELNKIFDLQISIETYLHLPTELLLPGGGGGNHLHNLAWKRNIFRYWQEEHGKEVTNMAESKQKRCRYLLLLPYKEWRMLRRGIK